MTKTKGEREGFDAIAGERLREQVGGHFICWTIAQHKDLLRDKLAYEMIANIDVFCASVKNVFVIDKRERTFVVAKERGWGRPRSCQLEKKIAEPDSLARRV